jgi:HEPN domain-containing protein
VCFLCQQAGEKAVKAVLEAEGLPVMRTHDIPALVKLLAARHHDAASMLTCAAILAAHAVGPRYPGVAGQATAEDATEALELATELVTWCGSKLGAADDADTLT